jgi:RNase adaptor protein for sRNA GlmZ degradation
VAVGCTGGQHRSVYIIDKLVAQFAADFPAVTSRHTGLKLQ